MLRIALVGIFLQLVLYTTTTEAICCDDIRSDVDNRTLAYKVLCSKNDPHLRNCCRVIEQDLRNHELSYRTLCPDHGKIQSKIFYLFCNVLFYCLTNIFVVMYYVND